MLGEEARVTSGRPSQPGPAACMHERPQDPPPSRLCPSPSSGSAARCSDPRPRFHGPALRESHSSMLLCECSPPSPLRTGLHVPGTSLLIGEDLADLTGVSLSCTCHSARGFTPSDPSGTTVSARSVTSSGDLHTPNHSRTNSRSLSRSPPPARLSTPAPGRLRPTRTHHH